MAKPMRCILHVNEHASSESHISCFTDERWERVKLAASAHLQQHTSKYHDICNQLPGDFSDIDGYHYSCYRKFIAVQQLQTTDSTEMKPEKKILRSDVTPLATSGSGVFPKTCIFCNKLRRKVKGKEIALTKSAYESSEKSIKDAAHALGDTELLVKIDNIEFSAKEVKYHNDCKRSYLHRAELIAKPLENPIDENINVLHSKDALACILLYVEDYVIERNIPEYLVSIHRHYSKFLERESENAGKHVELCKVETLRHKIERHFSERVCIELSSKKEGLVVFNSKLSKEAAFAMASTCNTCEEHTILEAASILRAIILDVSKSAPELPPSLSLDHFKNGQVATPDILLSFFTVLLAGSKKKSEASEETLRRAKSLSQDAMYSVTKGKIKPAKHLVMGVAFKSLTGSRRVIEILNRMGHSVGYNLVESIETEIASEIAKKGQTTPECLLKIAGLSTGVAFDNYDELSDTLSGKGSLHDTVSICYQNKIHMEAGASMDVQGTFDCHSSKPPAAKKRRRRQLEVSDLNLVPYKRRPSLSHFSYEIYEEDPPDSLEKARKMDMVWLILCHCHTHTPMWRGWNSLVCTDPLPQQIIGYMENIEFPPTRLDVVRETLVRSQKVAAECGEDYAITTYDLAIAKPALQLQAMEAPQFDNVFICFGAFHISMAYFGSLGYILESSGGPEIMCNADLLASGSLHGFISGKHFNRCKRLHLLLATGMQILHFRLFLQEKKSIPDACLSRLNNFASLPTPQALSLLLETDELLELLGKYEQFRNQTQNGIHGSTAQYWIQYADLVNLYLMFDRATRMNDLSLFSFALNKMCEVFFATHRPNYARWMTRYHLNLINMDKTHPGIRKAFEGGALSIRRTPNSFSRSAVDLTLEQTINRDAASRQSGIASFTQNISARKRWTMTRSLRGAVVGCLMEMAGLGVRDETSKELQQARIKRDNEDLERLIESISDSYNPFSLAEPDGNLYCLVTGKAASSMVREDLLHITEKGCEWKSEFLSQCKENPKRFEESIKRRKVKNFAHDAAVSKIRGKDTKLNEVKCTRDLFGRLLYLAATKGIDLKEVLSYPLTPIPLSLGHITGEMNKTAKSSFMKKLENLQCPDTGPPEVDVYLIDFMFFLRTLRISGTFGGIARALLQKACSSGRVVHIICDTYPEGPSLKDMEHDVRGESMASYKITNPLQRGPSDFNNALRSSSFKRALLSFLKDEWTSPVYSCILQGHILYFAMEQECFKYTVDNGKVLRDNVPSLSCSHEEADSRLIFHADFEAKKAQDSTNVVMCRSNDTDVFILLLHHSHYIRARLWMDAGLDSNNTRRLINISHLAGTITKEICDALPGFHALTGCDYTASFMRKAKSRPFEIMKKSQVFTSVISRLGEFDAVAPNDAKGLEEFVCTIYGLKEIKSVNDARLTLFNKIYSPLCHKTPLSKVKACDPSSLPPCRAVLEQKLQRCNYITSIWKNARKAHPRTIGPAGFGWRVGMHNKLELIWFEGLQAPVNLHNTDQYSSNDTDSEEETQTYNPSSDEDC